MDLWRHLLYTEVVFWRLDRDKVIFRQGIDLKVRMNLLKIIKRIVVHLQKSKHNNNTGCAVC